MKVIFYGYRGSKKTLATSSYLASKYLPKEFEIYYLNFENYSGKLFTGNYIEMNPDKQDVSNWSRNILEFLEGIDDEFVILGQDDQLTGEKINLSVYQKLLNKIKQDNSVASAMLGKPDYSVINYEEKDGFVYLTKDSLYSASGQICLWRTEVLKDILLRTTTAWDFEVSGSAYFNTTGNTTITSKIPALVYSDISALSGKWDFKIRLDGVKKKDVDFLIKNSYLDPNEII